MDGKPRPHSWGGAPFQPGNDGTVPLAWNVAGAPYSCALPPPCKPATLEGTLKRKPTGQAAAGHPRPCATRGVASTGPGTQTQKLSTEVAPFFCSCFCRCCQCFSWFFFKCIVQSSVKGGKSHAVPCLHTQAGFPVHSPGPWVVSVGGGVANGREHLCPTAPAATPLQPYQGGRPCGSLCSPRWSGWD